MDIPTEVLIATCIEQGSIYHFELETINKDGSRYKGNRFLIVLNANPKTDKLLILTTITSQIENAKKHIKNLGADLETLVYLDKSDFKRLSKDSVVNCNNVYPISKKDLMLKLEEYSGKVFFEKLSHTKIEALVGGVIKSNQVANEYKTLLV